MIERSPLVDAHCHPGENLAEELPRAAAAGVRAIVLAAARAEEFAAVRALGEVPVGEESVAIFPAFGVHPWYAAAGPENLEELLDRAIEGANGALLGEIGLDFARPKEEHALQLTVFRRQLTYAARRRLGLVIHSVRAAEETIALVREFSPWPVLLFHAVSCSADIIRRLAEMGGYFSFSARMLSPRRKKARAAAAAVPSDRLLLESDWPSADDSPSRIADALAPLARLRGESIERLAEQVWKNSQRFLLAGFGRNPF